MGIFDRIKNIFGKREEVETPPIPEEEREPLTPYITPPEHEALPVMRESPREFARPPTPPPLPSIKPSHELEPEARGAEMSNLKAKIDLLLTQVDSIKTQNQTINERLRAIEKTLAEMRGIRYY